MKRSREPEQDSEPTTPSGSSVSDEGAHPAAKVVELDVSRDALQQETVMKCSLPPHTEVIPFPSYEAFESHYNKVHTNRCLECSRIFPSPHLLNLHHEECHDEFVAIRREKGEHTYSCFVEDCERKCRTPQKRRLHLIDKHMYPKNYFFAVTRDGVAGRRSMLLDGGHRHRRSSVSVKDVRRRGSSAEEGNSAGDSTSAAEPALSSQAKGPTGGKAEKPDVDMDELSGAMSALQFIPSSVRFGYRRGGKVGFSKR
ncbi:hypothetical protein VTK73DRAFT_1864 [Phialemonium thermophilum]|uniref:C2H2-type domain-containing protein n=1 Tax=Phialemonium thermophilum TaxID=223376 RepID=A0ABR3X7K5_9PEZI